MNIKFLKAYKGDSIIISFQCKETNHNKHILIDGGMPGTYYDSTKNIYGDLKTEIDNIRSKNEYIDLLILTHIDNDHICGLLKWFEMDQDAYKLIKDVWFNSGKLVAEYLGEQENPNLNVSLDLSKTPFTGVKQATKFEDYLLDKKIWGRKLIKQGHTYEGDDIEILVLSPTVDQLKKLLKEYKGKIGDDFYTASGQNDWEIDLIKYVEEENRPGFNFEQDTSITNGSSLSFVINIKGIKILLLGDAHPNEIANYLIKRGYSNGNPINIDCFKLSHHGSSANINKELLGIVKTNNYVICTDSSGHGHPNKRTLARIIDSNKNAIFHFNYEYVKNNIFNKKDLNDYSSFKFQVTNEWFIQT